MSENQGVLSDTSPDACSEISPNINTSIVPLAKGAFPLEVRLNILENLTDNNTKSIARLMLACRYWYETVIGDTVGWKRRTEQLRRQDRRASSPLEDEELREPIAVWVKCYVAHCVDCKKQLDDDDDDYLLYHPILPDELPKSSLCPKCFEEFFGDNRMEHTELAALHLNRSDVAHLRCYDDEDEGSRHYSGYEISALHAKKSARRTAELEDILDQLSIPEQSTYSDAIDAIECSAPRLLKRVKAAHRALLMSTTCPPATQVLSLVSLYEKWLAVPALLEAYLLANPDQSVDLETATDALDWLYCSNGDDNQRRDVMPSWRDGLACGRKTFQSFLQEIKSPKISHAWWNCRCLKTPALLCPNDMCARCCSGCSRHIKYHYDSDEDRGYRTRSSDDEYY